MIQIGIKFLLVAIIVFPTFLYGAQQDLETSTNPAYHGDPATLQAGDVKGTMEANAVKQQAMNTELYNAIVTLDGEDVASMAINASTKVLTVTFNDGGTGNWDLSNAFNADQIPVTDGDGNYNAANVEGVLAEIQTLLDLKANQATTYTKTEVDSAIADKQDRVTGTCPVGQSIRVIYEDGTVDCEFDDGSGSTNLSHSTTATTVTVISSAGADTTLPAADATDAGVMTAADKVRLDAMDDNAADDQTGAEIKIAYEAEADTNAYTDAEKAKLAGIDEAATANSSDATLLARANHIGTQAASTISDFDIAVAANAAVAANTAKRTYPVADEDKLALIEESATRDQSALEVPFSPVGTIASNNVQAAIEEVANEATGANLGNVPDADSVLITSSSGMNTDVAAATTSAAGVMTAADKTALNTIATLDSTPTDGNTSNAVSSDGVHDAMALKQDNLPSLTEGQIWVANSSGTPTASDMDQMDFAESTTLTTTGAGTEADPYVPELKDTTVTAGSYTNADITVDAQGRIIAASDGSGGSGMSWSTVPTYEDSAGDAGDMAYDDDYLYIKTSTIWKTVALVDTLDAAPATGTLAISPISWDPADGTEGDTTATQTLTVTATGDVTFSSYALGGSNYFTDAGTGTCTQTEALSDSSCTIDLEFAYTAAGTYSDTLTITSDATDSPETASLGPVTVSSSGGGETIGESTTGSTVLSGDTSGWVYFYKVDGTLSSSGTLTSITASLRSQTGAREVRLALFTHDAVNDEPEEYITGSDTGAVTYTASSNPTDVTFDVIGSPSLTSGTTYWIAVRPYGYTAIWGETTGGSESFKSGLPWGNTWSNVPVYSNLPSAGPHLTTAAPGKWQITTE